MSPSPSPSFDPTRRSALAALGAGLLFSPFALAGAHPKRPPLSFLVVSDTHLGYQGASAAEEQWTKTAAELSKAAGGIVVHLGDVVDGGREPQYAVYKRIRDTIGKPVHEIPGNHDPHDLFEKHIRKPVDTAVDYEWLRFVLIGNARVDSHDGFVSKTQVAWIDEQCAAAEKEDKLVLLGMHVPAHENKHPDRGWFVKPDEGQKALYELVTRRRERILALFHGHFHNGLRGWDDRSPIHEVVFPSALYNQDRQIEKQKGPGYNLPEFRPGYTRVSIEEGKMRLVYCVTGAKDSADRDLPLKQIG